MACFSVLEKGTYMFGLFNKNKTNGVTISTPVDGNIIDISKVPDPTFSEKILGDGFAVEPSNGSFYAPADGEIIMVFDTLHAISLDATNGATILIHVGLDTVSLKGGPFKVHVKPGDKVKKGDLLITADLDAIKAAGLNTITPVVVCNYDDFKELNLIKEGAASHGDDAISLSK